MRSARLPCDTAAMSMLSWWTSLDEDTRDWLIAHNGETVVEPWAERILAAAREVDPNAVWLDIGRTGITLDDEAVDWIEARANDEDPTVA